MLHLQRPNRGPWSYIGCIRNHDLGSEAFIGGHSLGISADEDAGANAFYTYWDKVICWNGELDREIERRAAETSAGAVARGGRSGNRGL